MQQRAIDDTATTVIGVGDVSLALTTARGLYPPDVARAVHTALELGITLVEAGAEEDAERMCGDAVRSLRLRDRAILATQVPLVSETPGRPRDALIERLPPRYVQERIEATLRATKLDALPLAFLPVRAMWLSSTVWPEIIGACERMVREGKVLRWGARLDLGGAPDLDVELAEAAKLGAPFVALSVVYSACDRRAEPLLAGKLPVIAREPLAGGALAGTLGPGVRLSPRDGRNAIGTAVLERFAVGAARLAALVRDTPPAARSCDAARAAFERAKRPAHLEALTVAELALRYVIGKGAIALPRLHRHEHVAEAIAAASASALLSAAVHTVIECALPQG